VHSTKASTLPVDPSCSFMVLKAAVDRGAITKEEAGKINVSWPRSICRSLDQYWRLEPKTRRLRRRGLQALSSARDVLFSGAAARCFPLRPRRCHLKPKKKSAIIHAGSLLHPMES